MTKNKVPTLVTNDLINLYESAGLDPRCAFNDKTVNMIKANKPTSCLKNDIKKSLRILDEQDAVNRFVWYNLPSGLTGQFLERLLYYKAQLQFFYDKYLDKWLLLPYTLDGDLDIYCRFKRTCAIPMNGSDPLPVYSRKVIYGYDDIDENSFDEGCVLLRDYTNQLSETNISRQVINDPILDIMAEAFPMARTNLLANSGISGMRVPDEDSQSNVEAASKSIERASLEGRPFIPIVAQQEFQQLTAGGRVDADQYLQFMQALDNYRLSLYGLKNGGLFEKDNAYVNNIQAGNTQNNVGLVYQDGLTIRQHFCDLVNAVWGLGIWCEPSETVLNSDRNMNGAIADEEQPNIQESNKEEVVENE